MKRLILFYLFFIIISPQVANAAMDINVTIENVDSSDALTIKDCEKVNDVVHAQNWPSGSLHLKAGQSTTIDMKNKSFVFAPRGVGIKCSASGVAFSGGFTLDIPAVGTPSLSSTGKCVFVYTEFDYYNRTVSIDCG